MLKDKAASRKPERLAEKAAESAARVQVRVGSEAAMDKAGLVTQGSDSDVGVQQGSTHLRSTINFVAATDSSALDPKSQGVSHQRLQHAGDDSGSSSKASGGKREGSDANHGKKARPRRDDKAPSHLQPGSDEESEEAKSQAMSPSEALKAAQKLRRSPTRTTTITGHTAAGRTIDQGRSAQNQETSDVKSQDMQHTDSQHSTHSTSGGGSSSSTHTPRQYYEDAPATAGYPSSAPANAMQIGGKGSDESETGQGRSSQAPHLGAEQGRLQNGATARPNKGPMRKSPLELRALALFSRKPSAPLSPATPTKNRKEGTGVYMMRHTARRRERDAASRGRGE